MPAGVEIINAFICVCVDVLCLHCSSPGSIPHISDVLQTALPAARLSFYTNNSNRESGVLFACAQCLLREGAERKGRTLGV